MVYRPHEGGGDGGGFRHSGHDLQRYMAEKLTGDRDGAMAVGQQAFEIAAVLGDSASQVQASHTLGLAYHAIGAFDRAVELLQRNVEAADRASGMPSTDVRTLSQAWLARTLSAHGAFARRHGEEARRLPTLAGRGETPIIAHTHLGLLYLAKGERTIAVGLGSAYALQGRLAEACALLSASR